MASRLSPWDDVKRGGQILQVPSLVVEDGERDAWTEGKLVVQSKVGGIVSGCSLLRGCDDNKRPGSTVSFAGARAREVTAKSFLVFILMSFWVDTFLNAR